MRHEDEKILSQITQMFYYNYYILYMYLHLIILIFNFSLEKQVEIAQNEYEIMQKQVCIDQILNHFEMFFLRDLYLWFTICIKE